MGSRELAENVLAEFSQQGHLRACLCPGWTLIFRQFPGVLWVPVPGPCLGNHRSATVAQGSPRPASLHN